MSISSPSATSPAALRVTIRDVESRIRHRRSDINLAVGSIANQVGSVAHKVEDRIVSPAAIIAAGLFGAAIQRNHRMRGIGILAILPMASAGLRFLLKATSADERLSQPEKHEYAAAENEFTAEGAPV